MPLTDQEEAELLTLLEAEQRDRSRRAIDRIFPDAGPYRRELYPKHLAFFAAGATRRERAMMAGNRTGKSTAAAAEVSYHATGQYPAWWHGKRFGSPVTIWVAGDTVRDLRDSGQRLLLGAPGALGTGMIPGDAIVRTTARPGTPDATDTVHVRHASGGASVITLKSYEGGREAFASATVDVIWLDEEPSMAIYAECLVRTATTDGVVLATFTPLRGLSEVALHFMPEGKEPAAGTQGPYVCTIEWDDVPHLDADAKRELLASIPPHQRDARTKGVPAIGSGAIYPIAEADFVVQPFELPVWWPRGYGLDVGWNRTAAVWGAVDRETDTVFVYDEHYRGEAEPAAHAAAIRSRGAWMMGAIDPASRGRQQADGAQLLAKYSELGLHLVPADNAVESGLFSVWQRLSTGRLKVFPTCQNLLRELRIYRRDEKGKVVKADDHACDALRYFVVSGLGVASTAPGFAQRFATGGEPWRGERGDYRPGGGVLSEYDPFASTHVNAGSYAHAVDPPRAIPGHPADASVIRIPAAARAGDVELWPGGPKAQQAARPSWEWGR